MVHSAPCGGTLSSVHVLCRGRRVFLALSKSGCGRNHGGRTQYHGEESDVVDVLRNFLIASIDSTYSSKVQCDETC